MKLCDLVFTECSENVYQHGSMMLIRQFDHLNGRYLWTCTHTEVYIKRKATSSDHVTALRTWVSEAYAIRDASPSASVRAVLDGFIEPWHSLIREYDRSQRAIRMASTNAKRALRKPVTVPAEKPVAQVPQDHATFGGTLTLGKFVEELNTWLAKPVSEWVPPLSAWYEELFGVEYDPGCAKEYAAWLKKHVGELRAQWRAREIDHFAWRSREILRLRDEGYSHSEIANALQIAQGAVALTVRRAAATGITESKRTYLDWETLGNRFDWLMASDAAFRQATLGERAEALGITEAALRSRISHKKPGEVGSWTYCMHGRWVPTREYRKHNGGSHV